ncbi:MAG: methionyl-tRNA formyltransferase [Candidatus Sungbacteria bacterium RIFCSPHIGHO2_02_FULL_47_11]|uniref:Methionyl-tRNA formyltransferase n=1 Tax=Candidatus Sungbacteria bacterium RIFCSPHIGHO2_02_FULL_47_11 TaxID=1802270 RepID=A0A1G2KMI8_9BACT|nr:MAG: methionyl-tRNA formyltransferase [Candidatus Sungbacteria bacterium RIFCSPHIGHO2_02_FULL_47_11]
MDVGPRIIFLGTPDFALPPLDTLINNGYNVVAVVTNPDELVGRKQILTPPPIKFFAGKYKIPVYQPVNLKIKNWKLKIPESDLYIVAAYGKIIPREILEIPKHGVLNVHPSLLPRWRGPSPIQYALLNGDTKTGVTIIQMDELMDHGPVLMQRELSISKITYLQLHDELARLGATLLLETLPQWLNGKIKPTPQDDSQATYSKILTKESGRIDWSRTAEEIERKVRAFSPWPGAWTLWPTNKKIDRILIDAAEISDEDASEKTPGLVWKSRDGNLFIQTGRGSIAVKDLTKAGKKTMGAEAFLRGNDAILGTRLI